MTVRPIPQVAFELIKNFEGLRLEAYQDGGGVWTIGYGHTSHVDPHMRITEEQAEKFLVVDATSAGAEVARAVKVKLSDNQFAALVDFTFNLGAWNLQQSTMLRLLNRGWYAQVPAQLARWDKDNGKVVGGLTRRRSAEAALWLKGT